jgi:DNA-binding NarL/FixJ family response regulator
VVGEAGDARQAVKLVRERQPDIALLDWELPGQSGASALAKLRAVRPDLIVVALSGLPEARQAALDAGADVFVSKGDPPERLLEAVNEYRFAEKTKGVEK